MQVKSISDTQEARQEDNSMSLEWSDTFSKEEESLVEEIDADHSVRMGVDDFEKNISKKTKEFYNRTYVRLRFQELIIKLKKISKTRESIFLKGINSAELINRNFYIYEQYPVERQVLILSKFAISTIMKTELEGGYDFLLKILSDLVDKDLEYKPFKHFRRVLVQKKLIYFAEN